jgi:DNA-binding NtrC family response regulator
MEGKLMLIENHTVLIVDDEPTNLKLMDRLVKGSFRTITASSGEEAVQILQREEISILITDQCMPGISGTELLREARFMKPDIICLLMTASKDTTVFIEAMIQSGAIGVINKPWDQVKVMRTIHDGIEKYEARMKNTQSINRLKGAIASLDHISKVSPKS